jgi:phosphate transport system substrate-binding protein
VLTLALASCSKKEAGSMPTIKMSGSNTMAPISAAWAEAYSGANIVTSGGGSGIGIKQLIDGTIDICNSSRPLKDSEKEAIKAKHGKEVQEFHVGYDALAVFVHPDNPLESISVEQLTQIYGDGGGITTWEQIGTGGLTDPIEALGRESTSGTYEYFQEAICGKDDAGKYKPYRQGISAMSSSQAIIDTLATTKTAMGYDGMAFKTDKVKWLKLSAKTGGTAVEPSVNDARSGTYPLARKLFIYTVGEPEPHVRTFIDWILSPEGQKGVAETGAVTVN